MKSVNTDTEITVTIAKAADDNLLEVVPADSSHAQEAHTLQRFRMSTTRTARSLHHSLNGHLRRGRSSVWSVPALMDSV